MKERKKKQPRHKSDKTRQSCTRSVMTRKEKGHVKLLGIQIFYRSRIDAGRKIAFGRLGLKSVKSEQDLVVGTVTGYRCSLP